MIASFGSACLLLNLVLASASLAQGVTPVNPVRANGANLFPAPFASADAIAAQTATFIHGGSFGWNGTGWDRLQVDASKNLKVLINAAIPTGANTIGAVNLAQYTPVTGRLPVDGSGVTQPVSGTITANQGGTWNIGTVSTLPALPANQSVNVAQINGVTPLMGNGVTGTGSQRVTIASDNTAFTVNAAQSGTWTVQPGNTANTTPWLVKPHDGTNAGTIKAASTAAGTTDTALVVAVSPNNSVAVTQATAANLNARTDTSGATGAAPPARADFVGGLTSGATGGFVTGFAVCDSFVNVNVSTATTTLLVTGVSGRHVRICSMSLVTLAANNVALLSGTGATCGTGTTGMTGGTTAATGWNFAANGGITQGSGLGVINQTNATGDSVCIATSAATQLSGRIAYAVY